MHTNTASKGYLVASTKEVDINWIITSRLGLSVVLITLIVMWIISPPVYWKDGFHIDYLRLPLMFLCLLLPEVYLRNANAFPRIIPIFRLIGVAAFLYLGTMLPLDFSIDILSANRDYVTEEIFLRYVRPSLERTWMVGIFAYGPLVIIESFVESLLKSRIRS